MKNNQTKSRMNERKKANPLLAPPRFIDKLDDCYCADQIRPNS